MSGKVWPWSSAPDWFRMQREVSHRPNLCPLWHHRDSLIGSAHRLPRRRSVRTVWSVEALRPMDVMEHGADWAECLSLFLFRLFVEEGGCDIRYTGDIRLGLFIIPVNFYLPNRAGECPELWHCVTFKFLLPVNGHWLTESDVIYEINQHFCLFSFPLLPPHSSFSLLFSSTLLGMVLLGFLSTLPLTHTQNPTNPFYLISLSDSAESPNDCFSAREQSITLQHLKKKNYLFAACLLILIIGEGSSVFSLALRQKGLCWGQHLFASVTPTGRTFARVVSNFKNSGEESSQGKVCAWTERLGDVSPHWGILDKSLGKRVSYPQWRLLYCAIASKTFIMLITRAVFNQCPLFNSRETIVYIFMRVTDSHFLKPFFNLFFLDIQ